MGQKKTPAKPGKRKKDDQPVSITMDTDFSKADRAAFRYLLGYMTVDEERGYILSLDTPQKLELFQAAEMDLVDANREGELIAEDQARFNSHYLTTDRRRRMVLFSEDFREFTRKRDSEQ